MNRRPHVCSHLRVHLCSQVTCAMMEIYGRELRDLLNPKPKKEDKLKIRNGPQV